MATSIYICEECEVPLAKRVGGKTQTRDAKRKHLQALRDGCKEHPKAGIRLTFTNLAPGRGPEAIATAKKERTSKRATTFATFHDGDEGDDEAARLKARLEGAGDQGDDDQGDGDQGGDDQGGDD